MRKWLAPSSPRCRPRSPVATPAGAASYRKCSLKLTFLTAPLKATAHRESETVRHLRYAGPVFGVIRCSRFIPPEGYLRARVRGAAPIDSMV